MNKKRIVTIVVIIGVAIVAASTAWLILQPTQKAAAPDTDTVSQPEQNSTGEEVLVVYTDNGFEPKDIAAKIGDTLRVENKSSTSLEFSSDDHPAHTDNPELNMSLLQPGESGVITLVKAGEWGIHNHVKDEDIAKITVTK